jgi:bifunctional DNA-binding transcriptional regulator/antitoxin component of YhaV-PrlF toxin-antitoxin module
MMQSKVSVRGQTVIPQELREQLGIKPETKISWWARDGVLLGVPIPDDPIAASRGMLKGSGLKFQDFIAERNKERELERRHYDQMIKRTAPKRKTKRAG